MEVYSNVRVIEKSHRRETFVRRRIVKGLFRDCDFSESTFYDIHWGPEVIFERCNFTHANFRDCEAEETTFNKCNFSEAKFLDSVFDGADMSICRGAVELMNVSMDKARILKCDFSESNFIYSTFIGARIAQSALSGVDFYGSDLAGAYLYRVALTDSNIIEANNMSSATLKDCIVHPYSYWTPPRRIGSEIERKVRPGPIILDRSSLGEEEKRKSIRMAHIYCSDIKEFLSS